MSPCKPRVADTLSTPRFQASISNRFLCHVAPMYPYQGTGKVHTVQGRLLPPSLYPKVHTVKIPACADAPWQAMCTRGFSGPLNWSVNAKNSVSWACCLQRGFGFCARSYKLNSARFLAYASNKGCPNKLAGLIETLNPKIILT